MSEPENTSARHSGGDSEQVYMLTGIGVGISVIPLGDRDEHIAVLKLNARDFAGASFHQFYFAFPEGAVEYTIELLQGVRRELREAAARRN